MKSHKRYIKVEGHLLSLSNLEKVLFPAVGFTKKDLLLYYQKIAPTVLPYLRNRPFTLNRFPNGVDEPSFYEKQCPAHRPAWVETAVFDKTQYCLINNAASLLWVAGLAAIELHTTLGTTDDLECPTSIVFDLDPGDGAGFEECIETALLLRKLLERSGWESFPKTSGKKGIHIHVPLNFQTNYSWTKSLAKKIAETIEHAHSDLVVSKMRKNLRAGKVFIDWSQNEDFKTTATVYSLRPNSSPTVSTPVTWKELAGASRSPSQAAALRSLGPAEVIRRIERQGDLFRPVLEMRQDYGRRAA